ncbi:MAG: sulfotransferase, partial [Panacagrimonas sp.]
TRYKLDPQRPYQYHLDTAITPLTDYLIDLRGNLLTDFIGRYEHLQEDWEYICMRLGINPPALPHKRQATDRKKDYRSYYTDDLAQLVGDFFRRDVEMLGYRFDPE